MECLFLQDLPKPPEMSSAIWLLWFVLAGVGAFIAKVGWGLNTSVQEQKVAIVAHTAATGEMSATIKANTLVMSDLATQIRLLVQQITTQAAAIATLVAQREKGES